MRLLFAHGAGAAGPAAFPAQAAAFPRASFPVLPGYGDEAPTVGDVARGAHELALAGADADAVVGFSYGGVVALMAAAMEAPRALVLIEPAAFQVARDRPSCAALIARLEPIYLDATLTDETFERAMLTALTGSDPGEARTPEQLRSSRRARLHGAPWRHPVDASVVGEVPTLVLTGGWNAEYEEVAAALVEHGAEHEVLAGHGHRVIDHPECSERIRAFASAAA